MESNNQFDIETLKIENLIYEQLINSKLEIIIKINRKK